FFLPCREPREPSGGREGAPPERGTPPCRSRRSRRDRSVRCRPGISWTEGRATPTGRAVVCCRRVVARVTPDLRLVDTTREECLHRHAHALASRQDLEEPGGTAPVEEEGIEIACDRLESRDCGANLPEHASLRTIVPTGEAPLLYRTYVRCHALLSGTRRPRTSCTG